MKTIVAGSRSITQFAIVDTVLMDLPFRISEILCGASPGVATMAKKYAERNSIPVSIYANDKEGMMDNANVMVAFWDGISEGTDRVINMAIKKGLIVILANHNGRFVATYNNV